MVKVDVIHSPKGMMIGPKTQMRIILICGDFARMSALKQDHSKLLISLDFAGSGDRLHR
jgi:hypothetical protein